MIFEQSEADLHAWKTEMHIYQKNKRTKKPFGKNSSTVQHVTHQKMKAKECLFNPILQSFQNPTDQIISTKLTQQKRAKSLINHLKQTSKYQKNFDIINLHSNEPYNQTQISRKLGPIRNAYNVINNQKIPQFYFQNRQVRLPVEKQKKLLQRHTKNFNIVSNIYKQNHQQKINKQVQNQNNQIIKKYWQTHDYDPVFGKYYNQNKQKQYQQFKKQQQLNHGKQLQKKLPASYVYRQPLILDYTKPLPQTLKVLDQKNTELKKKYQLKYVVLDQYEKRNIEQQQKQEKILKNHIHFGRILDQKAKQFDIITNKVYKQSRAEQLYGKKLTVDSWDKLLREASKPPQIKKAIKTGGFV